jgi:hypothetical protein
MCPSFSFAKTNLTRNMQEEEQEEEEETSDESDSHLGVRQEENRRRKANAGPSNIMASESDDEFADDSDSWMAKPGAVAPRAHSISGKEDVPETHNIPAVSSPPSFSSSSSFVSSSSSAPAAPAAPAKFALAPAPELLAGNGSSSEQAESRNEFMSRRVAEIVGERAHRGKRKRGGTHQPTPHEAAQLEYDAINIASAGGGRSARARKMPRTVLLACAGSVKAAKRASCKEDAL